MQWRIVPNPGHVWPVVSQDTPQGPVTWYPDNPDVGPTDPPGTTHVAEPLMGHDGTIVSISLTRKDAAGVLIDVQMYRTRTR